MKLGAFTCWLSDQPLDDALDLLVSLGLSAVEVGTGGYPGDAHCRPAELLANSAALAQFRAAFATRGLTIGALSCNGNPLHPRAEIAELHHAQFRDTVLLAETLGVEQVVAFAGCPGTPDGSSYPNWVTSSFPGEFGELLSWQWQERVLPYWREQAAFCRAHGVRVAIELHPDFVVYNTETLLRLRAGAGETIGAAYDPSHLFWQQMDPLEVVRALGPAIYHVHMKDTVVNWHNVRRNGVIDTAATGGLGDRAWVFRTVGYGHDAQFWKALVSELHLAGYRGMLSIEAEDSMMSRREGLARAAHLLRDTLIEEAPDAPWWPAAADTDEGRQTDVTPR
jgi:sugar phosphate isomerase/epimerase